MYITGLYNGLTSCVKDNISEWSLALKLYRHIGLQYMLYYCYGFWCFFFKKQKKRHFLRFSLCFTFSRTMVFCTKQQRKQECTETVQSNSAVMISWSQHQSNWTKMRVEQQSNMRERQLHATETNH